MITVARATALVKMSVDDAPEQIPGVAAHPRRAVVRSRVTMRPDTVAAVAAHSLKKGDVLATARFAGVHAAKGASSLLVDTPATDVRSVTVDFTLGGDAIDVEVAVEVGGDVSAVMPAFSGATVAALTLYDMCKSADRTMVIGPVALVDPTGGEHLSS